jgi:S-formylglutathione hydrolase FrmB
MLKAIIVSILLVLSLLLSIAPVHAKQDTGPGDIVQLFRDIINYIINFFANPESSFNASAINNHVLQSGLPLVELEHRSFFSHAMNKEKNYTVLLPPGYHTSSKRYPVYYLLHGAWGDERTWVTRGNITEIYQEMLAGGMGEIIIAMPDGDNSVWENGCSLMSCGNYEDYLIEFVNGTDARYRTTGKRAIGGLSFGARGAMRIAFLHPDLFGFVGAHSGYYYYLIQEMKEVEWNRLKSSNLTVYFDNSKNDPLTDYSESSKSLNQTLAEKGIPHIYSEPDFFTAQSHAWPYWKRQIAIAIEKACLVICI